MKKTAIWFCLLLAVAFTPAIAEEAQPVESQPVEAEEPQMSAEEAEYLAWAKALWDSLDRQQGDIVLPEGNATIHVPENFYYLSPADTEKVLVEVWGNPPGSETLGMLFPSEVTPFDGNAWGVTIAYEEEGYVSDEDARDIDFGELLEQMQEDTHAASEARLQQGYEAIELVGWATQPYYDETTRKLYWAKELKFGDTEQDNTLNYNIRVLGRKGVLLLNFIAGMNQKELIDGQVNKVLAMAEFNPGSRYEDFNPDLDKVAAYGIGALVAGKVIAKTGLIAAALIFLKKFGVLIVIGLAALFGKFFRRKQSAA